MISRNRTFVTVYLAGACEKQPHTVLSLIPSLQGLELKVAVHVTFRAWRTPTAAERPDDAPRHGDQQLRAADRRRHRARERPWSGRNVGEAHLSRACFPSLPAKHGVTNDLNVMRHVC